MEYKYEVVLSFAGEQREYVEKVVKKLSEIGISFFYDYNEEVELWGKNLSQYLDRIYFYDGLYFIPFISKEYIDKIWTKLEFSSALDRNMIDNKSNFQQYILPVRFEKIRVPGLPDSIGFIDANRYSPEELAKLIYQKVRNQKLNENKINDINNLPPQKKICDVINTESYNLLKKSYETLEESKAILVYGERGLGKTTTIEKFFSTLDVKKISIKTPSKSSFVFEPIATAFSIEHSFSTETLKINFPEFLKKEIYKNCENNTILYFQDVEKYEIELFDFCQDIVRDYLVCFPEKQIFIIFEYNSDDKTSFVDEFYQLPPQSFDTINFKQLTVADIRKYLKYVFINIEIDIKDLNYICDASFKNIMYVNTIINFLKSKDIIYKDGEKYVCRKITPGILKNVLKNHIIDRYNRLDDELKIILLKSNILGEKFSSVFLSESFDIDDADEMLTEIEEISVLIKQEEKNLYLFENNESYRIIKEKIEPSKQKEWNEILAVYFQNRLMMKEKVLNSGEFEVEEQIKDTYPIFYHFKEAKNYEKCLPYALKLIGLYSKISDFAREDEILSFTNTIINKCNLTDKERIDIEFKITKAKAINKQMCSHYLNAITLYELCINILIERKKEEDIPEIEFNCAYCYYMLGNYQKALQITQKIKSEIENIEKFDYLYCKTLSFLASIYDLIRNTKKRDLYFTNALNIAKENDYEEIYYSLLKKASLVFYEEMSLPMYDAANQYFQKTKQLVKQAEVLHNIATDSFYLEVSENILENAKHSIELFDSIGNNHAHYPYNTCGLFELLYTNNYDKAHTYFEKGLSYKNEPFSKITLHINNAICYIKENNIAKAEEIFKYVDELIENPINTGITVFNVYHSLNWGVLYYHKGDFAKCIEELKPLWSYSYLEQRHEYIARILEYNAKLKLNIDVVEPTISAPLPILNKVAKDNIYFCTIRFFE